MRAQIAIKQEEQKKQSDYHNMLNQIIRNLEKKIKTVQSNEQEAQRLERIDQANLALIRETKLHTNQMEKLTQEFNSAIDNKKYEEASQIYTAIRDLMVKRVKTHPNDKEGYQTIILDLHNKLMGLHQEQGAGQAAEQEGGDIEELTKKFNLAIYNKNYEEASQIYREIYKLMVKRVETHPNENDVEEYQKQILDLYNVLMGLRHEQGAEQAAEQNGAGNNRKKRKSKSKKSRKTNYKKSKKTKSRRHWTKNEYMCIV